MKICASCREDTNRTTGEMRENISAASADHTNNNNNDNHNDDSPANNPKTTIKSKEVIDPMIPSE